MTKVEEILDKLERGFMPRGTYAETWKLIDAALAAAEFLGMKKQKELDAIWARIDALVVAEARGFAKGHAEGVAEGRADEKSRWKYKLDRCASRFDMGEEISCAEVLYQKNKNGFYAEAAEDLFILPASSLVSTFAPLLTEDDLNSPIPASVLAPTKEAKHDQG